MYSPPKHIDQVLRTIIIAWTSISFTSYIDVSIDRKEIIEEFTCDSAKLCHSLKWITLQSSPNSKLVLLKRTIGEWHYKSTSYWDVPKIRKYFYYQFLQSFCSNVYAWHLFGNYNHRKWFVFSAWGV